MLVQRRDSELLLFTQHDHGVSCGELLRRWTAPGPPPCRRHLVELATALHDIAWTEEDAEPRFNPKTGQPYDFTDLPVLSKAAFYTEGIELSERVHPYVGLIQSLHYAPFMPQSEVPGFRASEEARQARLRDQLTAMNVDLTGVEEDLACLRGIDVLSLYMCVAQPGCRPETVPRWLPPRFSAWGNEYELGWCGDSRLRVIPFPFASSWQLTLPHRRIASYTFESADSLRTAWKASRNSPWQITISD